MPIRLSDKGGAEFAPIPAGVQQGICYGVVDIGTQKSPNPQHKPQRKIVMVFELPFERGDFGDRKNLPRAISMTLTQSLNPKATLRGMLESWRGKPFTQEQLEGFDPKVLLGVNCLLNIVHTTKDGKTYANIKAIMPLAHGMQKMQVENKPLYFSLDDQDLTNLVFPEHMPEWMQKRVTFCEEVIKSNGDEEQGDGPTEAEEEAARAAHEADVARHAQGGGGATGSKDSSKNTPPHDEEISGDVPF